MERRLKKPVIYFLYGLGFVFIVSMTYLIEGALTPKKMDKETNYVSETIFDETVPVVSIKQKIIRPYNDSDIKILSNFYDYKGTEETQKNALIVYDKTYMQSSGVTYGGKENFDVINILDGTVISVREDELLGKIVEVSHSNDVISVYQSLSAVNVKVDDIIKQGQIIGKSGTSNVNKDLGSSLYFELMIKGSIVDPELYYDKSLNEI